MKSLTIKKAIVLLACLFMIPVASFAATKTTTHKDPAVAACAGKKAGDEVTMTHKGKKIEATCQEVNGALKAVAKMK